VIKALNVRFDRIGRYRHSSVFCLYILTDLYLHAFLYKLLGVIKSCDISEEYSNNLWYDWNAWLRLFGFYVEKRKSGNYSFFFVTT